MGMYIVNKALVMSAFTGPFVSYEVTNRKTGKIYGCYQQLGLANAMAASLNGGVC